MRCDVAIIGAGIAGASLAAELAPSLKVVLFEAESQAGYHSTGRSNALWHESYGGPGVQPLTKASLPTFRDGGYLTHRDTITICRGADFGEVDAFVSSFEHSEIDLQLLNRADLDKRYPDLKKEWRHGVLEAASFDIDVARFHQSYLATARRAGADIRLGTRISDVSRIHGQWRIGDVEAGIIVNAAGAWASDFAELCCASAISVMPYRRTITQLRLKSPVNPDLPFLIDVNGGFYFRPEGAERVWLSPHDESETPPCDAAPEELDIAVAIDRFQQVVDWPIAAVEHSWAGLRSFAPDRLPLFGFDPKIPDFFWCAGQGGFGIQTAPAAAKVCGYLITGTPLEAEFAKVDPKAYCPSRFA